MECFTVMSEEIEGRLSPAYYKIKNPFLKSKYELIDIEDYFIVNPKFQNRDNLKEISFLPMKHINPDLQQVDKFDIIEIEKIKGYTPFEEGDLVFAKVTPCMENGNIAICEKMPFKIGVGTSEIYVFREKQKNKITNRFLKSLFSLTDFRQFAKNNFTGTGGLQRVPRDFFNNLKIPLPSLETQNKIVQLMDKAYSSKKLKETESQKLLDSINDYVLDELGIKLPELKDKMTYVVSSEEVKNNRIDPRYYKPHFKKFEDELNKRKDIKDIGEISESVGSGSTPRAGGEDYTSREEGIPFIRIVNLKNNTVVLDDVLYIKKEIHNGMLKRTQLKPNDVLLSMAGTIGLSVVVPKDLGDANINQAIARIVLKNNINPFYLSALLNSKLGKFQTDRLSRPSVQANINLEEIRALKIPLPPLSVQNKIADEVKKRMQKAETLQKEAKQELEKAKAEVEKIILG